MDRELTINQHIITDNSNCYLIAEIGHNHQGKLATCKELFIAAKENGADAVKLQKRDNRTLFTAKMYQQRYNSPNSFAATYGQHREYLELQAIEYYELQRFAKEIGITFLSTAFDFKSADFLAEMDLPAFKISSGDLTNIPLLKHVASYQKPMLVSTGGNTFDNIKRAYHEVMSINPRLCFLQCTSAYPPQDSELNLRVIQTLKSEFPDIVIGLSSHSSDIFLDLVGYTLGAQVIEKHFTLDRKMKGTDHQFSLEPPHLNQLRKQLDRTKQALGDGVKTVYASEKNAMYKMSKKLVFANSLEKGQIITREDIAIRSPYEEGALPPYELEKVIGKRVKDHKFPDDDVMLTDLQ